MKYNNALQINESKLTEILHRAIIDLKIVLNQFITANWLKIYVKISQYELGYKKILYYNIRKLLKKLVSVIFFT